MRTIIPLLRLVLSTAAIAAPCDSLPGADPLLKPGTVVLLGEIHGTRQGPGMVQRLICPALEHGLDVIVGLEIPVENQPNLDRYLESEGGDSARAGLIAGDFWQRDYQDGRASHAMVKLIEALRAYGHDNPGRVHVVCLDNPEWPRGRDHHMATRLDSALTRFPEALAISLTGNIHSQFAYGSHFDPEYEPMGYQLHKMRPDTRITSLDMEYADGTAWVCAAGYECGVMLLSGSGSDTGPSVVVYDRTEENAAQGYFEVGEITASPPARDPGAKR